MNKNLDSINHTAPKITISSTPKKPNQLSLLKVKPRPRTIFKKIVLGIILIIFVLGAIVAIRASNLSDKIFVGQKTTFFGKILNIIRGGGDSERLIGEDLGQINILLLGIGGEGHDGPYLSDTMILAQIRPDIGQITLTSIPRDYWIKLPDGSEQKINAAFSYGYIKNHDFDEGGKWARESVEKMSGLKIPYFAVMDFSGFEKAVDKVGGVDIQIQNTFTDYTYPDNGVGYLPPVTFTEGLEHMNGVRALEFARSRHAAGIEGSDFARGLRQQKIIESFKQKVLSGNIITSISNINELIGVFAEHFHTNLTPGAMLRIYNLFKNKDMQILSLSLDPETTLVCPEILASNSAYVLVPCKSEQDIINFFKNSFSIGKLVSEKSVVWLASSTGNRAAYNTAFRKLTNAGIIVFELTYTKDNLSQTTVYQVHPKPATAEFAANELNGTIVNLPPPGVHISENKVDVIVVLGQNAPIEATPPAYIPPPAKSNATTSTSTDIISTTTPAAIK